MSDEKTKDLLFLGTECKEHGDRAYVRVGEAGVSTGIMLPDQPGVEPPAGSERVQLEHVAGNIYATDAQPKSEKEASGPTVGWTAAYGMNYDTIFGKQKVGLA